MTDKQNCWKLQKEKNEAQSSSLLKTYGYDFDKDDYFDVVNFVNCFGFDVGNATKLNKNDDGFLLAKPFSMDNKIIGVNDKYSIEQKRYIVAYEFARFILRHKIGTAYFHKKSKGCPEEKEVKHMATALLMPKTSFLRLYTQYCGSCLNDTAMSLQLAAAFKVPMDCVIYRIQELGLLHLNLNTLNPNP